MALSREQKIEKARELREQGATYREIGEKFSVSTSAIYRWLNPERTASYRSGRACNPERARKLDREYNRRHRGECPQCGGEMARKTARVGGKCRACHEDEADRRARQIQQWWAEGLGQRQIAKRLGWSINHLSVEKHRLREAGYNLPYRYKSGRRFTDQVQA